MSIPTILDDSHTKVDSQTSSSGVKKYLLTTRELEEFEVEAEEYLAKVVHLDESPKRYRYRFTAKEIEEFEPNLKI